MEKFKFGIITNLFMGCFLTNSTCSVIALLASEKLYTISLVKLILANITYEIFITFKEFKTTGRMIEKTRPQLKF